MDEKNEKKVPFWQMYLVENNKQKMDLPYPTMKKANLGQELNYLDKLGRSILLSARDIPREEAIPKKIKACIQKIICSDDSEKLSRFLEKEVVNLNAEIGTIGSQWNVLHFCAKSDALKCIEFVLKAQYQEMRGEYEGLLNSKTVEELTPIMVAIINRSHGALELMLTCGGVDIHVIDENKMSPYEIALNYRNDKAIKLLMNYQSQTKKKDFINQEFLAQPMLFPKKASRLGQKCSHYLLCCLSLGFYIPNSFYYDDNDPNQDKHSQTSDGPNHRLSTPDGIIEDGLDTIDYVPIGSRKILPGYDIEWKRAANLMESRVSLFESYNPFDTKEKNFTIKNNLIIFQCLTNVSWLLRKHIKSSKSKVGAYEILLYPQRKLEKVLIDDFIPYIKDREEAMFLSNSKELWPMILQKALAKLHQGYFSLTSLSPLQLIEELTGFPTFQKDLSLLSGLEIFDMLVKMSREEFIFCLKGKSGSKLSESEKGEERGVVGECFSVLNFYQKNGESLILVNCPFVSDYWKKKEKQEALALKLIKGHYNTHNQMCVWVCAEEIKEYFSALLICNTFSNYERTELRINTKKAIFFKFRVEKIFDPNGDQVFMQLSNHHNRLLSLARMELLKDEGTHRIPIQKSEYSNYSPELAELVLAQPGEYFGYFELDQFETGISSARKPSSQKAGEEAAKEESALGSGSSALGSGSKTTQGSQEAVKQYLLVTYSPFQSLQPECLDEEFGILEWFGLLKNEFKGNNDFESGKSLESQEQFLIKTIGEYTMILLKEKENAEVLLRFGVAAEKIIEGRRVGEEKIELLAEDNVFYCILRCKINEDEVTFDII